MKSKRPLRTTIMMIMAFTLCGMIVAAGSGTAGIDNNKVTLDKVHDKILTIPEELKKLEIKDSYYVLITLEEYVQEISIEKSHDIKVIAKKGYGDEKEKDCYNINIITGVTPPPPLQHTITATAGSGGSITPSGAVVVDHGANQTFTITPSTGYLIAGVVVDGSSVGAVASYTFTNVSADHTISASFAINTVTFTITASAGAGGSISPPGNVAVSSGANQAFTITATNSGYHIADVLVDGVSQGAISSYTFTNVTANHTIAASFALNNIYPSPPPPPPPPMPPYPPELVQKIVQLETRVQSLESDQAKLEGELARVRVDQMIQIQKLKAQIESVQDQAQQQIERLNYRIATVQSEAATERKRLQDNIDHLSGDVENKTRSLQSEIQRVERRAADEISRLERTIQLSQQQEQQDVRRLEQQMATMQSETDRRILLLDVKLQGVRQDMSLVTSRITALESQTSQLKEQVSDLKAKVFNLQMRVVALETKLTKLVILDP